MNEEFPEDDAEFAAFLADSLDPGDIELGPDRHAELLAAMGTSSPAIDPAVDEFAAFLSARLDPGSIELAPVARREILDSWRGVRPGEMLSWAVGELPASRTRTLEDLFNEDPGLREEALSLRQFCLHLRQRLPQLAAPGYFQKVRLKRLFRERSIARPRHRQVLAGLAALLAILLVPTALMKRAAPETSSANLLPTRPGLPPEESETGRQPTESPPSIAETALVSPPETGSGDGLTIVEPAPPIHAKEPATGLAARNFPGTSTTPPVDLPVSLETTSAEGTGFRDSPPATSRGISLADNRSFNVALERSSPGSLASHAALRSGLTPAHDSAGAISVALTRMGSFVDSGASYLLVRGAVETAVPGDPGEPEGPPVDPEQDAPAKTASVAEYPAAATLANLQPYLLTALMGSTGNPLREIPALEDGWVWNANADFRTLDFDSFVGAAGMSSDTWTGTVSLARALTDELTFGADLSLIDSRARIDRYGRLDISGTVAGASFDWQHGPWEASARYSLGDLRQELSPISRAVAADQSAFLQQADLQVGWKTAAGPYFRHGPIAQLQATWGDLDPYQEVAGASIAGRDFRSTAAMAGWEITGALDSDAGLWQPRLLAGWRHRIDMPDSIIVQGHGQNRELLAPGQPERDSLILEGGLRWLQKNGPFYAEGAAGIEWRGGDADRNLLLRIGARF